MDTARQTTSLRHIVSIVWLLSTVATADIVDRIAVAVGNHAIKESQIDHELRLTAFQNGAPLDEGAASKRKAADHLIDQTLIRAEMAKGSYPEPSNADVNTVLTKIKRARFHSDADYEQALKTYGISEPELTAHIAWQIRVVRFVDQRFQKGSPSADNAAFFAWLDATRKASRIQYHDEALR